ncbi:MAG: asparagine synthase (glutamine-hydrolyzing) [Chitinophagia bacterium]
MCGITGILHFQQLSDPHIRVKKMTNALAHRGPDAEGYFHDHNISLGHRRLSIIDLTDAANQPFYDPNGRYVLVFNGEIYNYQELKQKLNNYPFQTSSDTEVLMAAFIKWGINSVQEIKGMFAFAIWDKQMETLWLARDRMGVKPLVYYIDDKKLVFASERRALLASGLVPPSLNKSAVADYLSFQSAGYPDTMIQGVELIKAGTWMKVDRHAKQKETYWSLSQVKPDINITPKEAELKIFDLMNKAVSSRMITDVPLGAFLSGGIDSSAVVALMQLQSGHKINTFNLSFTEKEYDESAYADIIAKRFGTKHQKYLLDPDQYVSQVSSALDAMDSPTMDGVNTFVLSTAIRNAGIKVAMSGIGGDELFAGYPGFLQFRKIMQRKSGYLFSLLGRKALAALLRQSKADRHHRMAALLSIFNPSIQNVYPALRRVLSQDFIKQVTTLEQDQQKMNEIFETETILHHGSHYFSEYSIAEYIGYTQQTLLKDADQMSMAVGLEIREPFFDHELVEFVLSLNDEIKYPHYPKQLLVETLDPLLPKEIVHRKKQGFVLPWEHWMRNELKSFCTEAINSIAERDFINAGELKSYWKRFVDGDPNVRWTEPWLFVVLSHWLNKQEIN